MIKQITAAALLAVTSFAASAAEPSFYVGGDVGSSKPKDVNSETSYGVFGGYKFDENFAVEAGFRRLGNWEEDGIDDKVTQLSLSVLGSVPVADQVAVYGRLGYNRVEEKFDGDKESKNKVLFGLGVSYQITKEISARVEWQRPVSHSRNISVGVAYHF
ncbi:OmpA-OmpF porin, OOP family [Duganella sp. CF458]|uniref:outer membrane beta-barrel protein n=1 Tax=Duganella sp. CF458 TaxID=1884368 RepID=UPI0008E6F2A8|nr:outer membrane beta-barrel protein [Duganella sp. CF458]SFG01761.1 OmpA-OmpF porin, OOP family [Duganella sp. CF458]